VKTQKNAITKIFFMSDATWRRHANPWSAWTRIVTCLPLLTLSLWSRAWIGRWSLLPLLASLLWVWINPRVFPEPESTDNWASQGVFGERVWLYRDMKDIVPEYGKWTRSIMPGKADSTDTKSRAADAER